MTFVYGVVLLLVGIGMLWFGRPARGEASAPFLRVWIVGQLYAMVAIIAGVAGVGFLLSNWPAWSIMPDFEPPHRTAQMIGEAIAWAAILSVAILFVVLYNVRHY